MSPDVFAEFYRLCGHKLWRTGSTWWYDAHPRFLLSVPYHAPLSPGPGELEDLFRSAKGLLGARYFGAGEGQGKASYLIVCSDKSYRLESLGHKARNQTRLGLKRCQTRPLDWREAASANYLNQDTWVRQGRAPEFTDRQWARLCEAGAALPGFECWGAFSGAGLAAMAVAFRCGDHVDILHQASRTAALGDRPNNALIFEMTRGLLARPEVGTVCYGPEPLEELAGLDRFKLEMSYSHRPLKQLGILNRRWGALSWPVTRRAFELAAAKAPPGGLLRKTSGILRLVADSGQASAGGRGLEQARAEDLAAVAMLHQSAFPTFFLTSLGQRFLRRLYAAFLAEHTAVTLVWREAGLVRGFAFGVCRPRGFVMRTILRRGLGLLAAFLPAAVRRPRALLRVLYGSLRPALGGDGHGEAVLFSIAVDPVVQGRGIGCRLTQAFLARAAEMGAGRVSLTTDRENNGAVNRFYVNLGFSLRRELRAPEGRRMNEYAIELGSPEAKAARQAGGCDVFARGVSL